MDVIFPKVAKACVPGLTRQIGPIIPNNFSLHHLI